MALHNERHEEQFPKTVIVQKTVEDHKAVASDILGASKNLGQGQADRGPDFVHGIKNITGNDPWNAARCIHGEPTSLQIQPDRDLGKSTKPNCRNVVRDEKDKYRAFGVPTIRTDVPFKDPSKKSVADYQVSINLTPYLTLIFHRITEMSQRLLTFFSHPTTPSLASERTTSGR